MVDLESDGKTRRKKSSATTKPLAKTTRRKKPEADVALSAPKLSANGSPGSALRSLAASPTSHNGHKESPAASVHEGHPSTTADAYASSHVSQGIRSKITEDERRRLIAEAAYRRAERRGFRGGNAQSDWLEAEAEIDAKLLRQAVKTRS